MKTRSLWMLLGLTVAIFIAATVAESSALPAKVATHFDAAGRPNAWMSRAAHLQWSVMTGLAIPLFVIGLCHCIRFLPPSTLNVPHASFWRAPENHGLAAQFVAKWSLWFGMASLLWTTAMNHELAVANQQTPPALSSFMVMVWTGIYLVALLGSCVILILQFVRPPAPTKPSGFVA